MSESFRTRLMRWSFNLFPAYRRTGARLTYIQDDLREVHVTLPLNWKTRNYVGTIFGGSIYAAVDPIYMVMFIKLLGLEYIVWDKSATIEFLSPGRSTLHAQFVVKEQRLERIRALVANSGKTARTYQVELRDEQDEVCAAVEQVLYFQRKRKVPENGRM